MDDDLKERFRALDTLDFPHDEGPPDARSSHPERADTRARRVATAVFALVVGATALGFAIRAFERGTDRRPPATSEDEVRTRPGACDHGPWIEHCPEADWARSVISVAGLGIEEEQTVLVVGASEGGQFLFWAMDPSLHGQVTPLSEIVAGGEAEVIDHVDGVPIHRVGGDRRFWLWGIHGLNVFVDGREARGAPSRQDLVALVRASGSVPYAPATPSAGVTVPDVVGLSDQEAMRMLDGLGLSWVVAYRTVDGVDPWHVASSDPVAGTPVAPGSSVRVLVATTVTPLPAGAADALDCDRMHREAFGGPRARVLPGDSAYIHGNLPGIIPRDDVVQVTFEDEPWMGLWHLIRDGSVVAVVDYGSLDGEACQGSGVAGA